jgi:hypothetical protein
MTRRKTLDPRETVEGQLELPFPEPERRAP